MHTFEERIMAVELYIQSWLQHGTIVRILGLFSRYVLRLKILETHPKLLGQYRTEKSAKYRRV